MSETTGTMDHFGQIVHEHKSGVCVGIYSVCSAHPTVLEAAMQQAMADGTILLVEATSNQVDQFGGYTGMTPASFRDFVLQLAKEQAFPVAQLVLGGDHLGPNRWQADDPDVALANAADLVAAYVTAGYTKIHLDCSMPLRDDALPLSGDVVAERAARLLMVAEETAAREGTTDVIRYVIGTEVPVPGGAHETLGELRPTSAAEARATLESHRASFARVGLASVWPRVNALVVQPGVEFDHIRVVDYDRSRISELRHVLDDEPDMVFEAHSTDYQLPERLTELVDDHWAVLKVGPGLTFALREGLFALAEIENQLVSAGRSRLTEVVDEVMIANPEHWSRYYEGSDLEQRIARRYSYSDRLRYYWPHERIAAAEDVLHANLERHDIPLPLISQYLPDQYLRVRRGALGTTSHALVRDRVRDALRPYANACRSESGMSGS